MKITRDEFYEEQEEFNRIYQELFDVFISGITKKNKATYYNFVFDTNIFKGRAYLPDIKINYDRVKERAFEMFKVEYEETKFYPNYLIEKFFPEIFEEIYNSILFEEIISEIEIKVDLLIDTVFEKAFA